MGEDNRLTEYYKNKGIDVDVAKKLASDLLEVAYDEISNISILKKGFTNTSFVFEFKNKKYIMRVPGKGTEKIINRKEEANVYETLKGKNVSEEIVFIDGNTGYKIAEFYDNARCADSYNEDDIKMCMKKLKTFHNMNLSVNHDFNLFEKINYYEKMWNGNKPRRENYYEVKSNILKLKDVVEKFEKTKKLCHIDSLADNFLIIGDEVKLIDWEYSGMQDPHLDIAMFAIYAMYNKEQLDRLIDIYFEECCDNDTRIKIYCYIAICGLLWNNWAEYKINLGEEMEEYAISQFKYAEEYYHIVKEELRRYEE